MYEVLHSELKQQEEKKAVCKKWHVFEDAKLSEYQNWNLLV
jgi:hypothetical protein